MLPNGNPEVTMTSCDSCPSTLRLCEHPRRNSFTHTSTIGAIFLSRLTCGTKSKTVEKSIIIRLL